MSSIVNINGRAVERIEYKGVPVITLPMVDDVHSKATGMARAAFNRHKKRMAEGKHFFVIPLSERDTVLNVHDMHAQTQKQRGGYRGDMVFLTQVGYVLLVKVFDDDLAWQIYEQMVDSYFSARQEIPPFDRRVEIQHSRRTEAPGGLDVKYTLDLTKICLRPTRAGLAILERLTGIHLDDIISETPGPDVGQFNEVFTAFYETCCTKAPATERLLFKGVYAAFVKYSASSPEPVFISRRRFSQTIQAAGHDVIHQGGNAWITALRLKDQ